VHGDGKSAVNTAKEIKDGLIKSGVILKPLDKMKKFI
jgi:lactam utilization protein B